MWNRKYHHLEPVFWILNGLSEFPTGYFVPKIPVLSVGFINFEIQIQIIIKFGTSISINT